MLLTLITMAEPFPISDSRRSSRRASLTSHRGRVFGLIPVEDSISRQSKSIFPSPRYRASDIPCTFSRCHRSRASNPITPSSTDFVTLIEVFEWSLINSSALDFSVSNAEIDPDWKYPNLLNLIYDCTPIFCSASFKTSIKSASSF